MSEKTNDMRIYELGFLLVPTIPEENVALEVTALKDMISARGGVFIAEDFPRSMELAYRMEKDISNRKEKFTSAYFGWMKFEIDPLEADKIAKELEKSPKLVRHILFKTVKENTIASRKPLRDTHKKAVSTEPKE